MLLEAWLLSKIADKVFSYASDKGSGIVEEWVRDKLGLEPRKKAFKRALDKASQKLEKKYSQWAADLFNASFFEYEAAPILAQFLVQDGNPDPSELATLWARSLNIHRPERRTMLIVGWEADEVPHCCCPFSTPFPQTHHAPFNAMGFPASSFT